MLKYIDDNNIIENLAIHTIMLYDHGFLKEEELIMINNYSDNLRESNYMLNYNDYFKDYKNK